MIGCYKVGAVVAGAPTLATSTGSQIKALGSGGGYLLFPEWPNRTPPARPYAFPRGGCSRSVLDVPTDGRRLRFTFLFRSYCCGGTRFLQTRRHRYRA